jgi:fatty acid desaturase
MVLLPWAAAWRVALLWFLGWYTMFGFCLRVRSIGEHRGVPDTNELTSARHVDPFLWDRIGLYPHNISYHIVHHMFPSVPYYNLPKLHERLKRESPAYAQEALIEHGFSGVLGKLLV